MYAIILTRVSAPHPPITIIVVVAVVLFFIVIVDFVVVDDLVVFVVISNFRMMMETLSKTDYALTLTGFFTLLSLLEHGYTYSLPHDEGKKLNKERAEIFYDNKIIPERVEKNVYIYKTITNRYVVTSITFYIFLLLLKRTPTKLLNCLVIF